MSDESNSTLFAMVALNAPGFPDLPATLAELSKRLPRVAVDQETTSNESTAIFGLNGNRVAVSTISAPIPWQELEGPCATAWWWPEATEKMKPHQAHLIVALLGDDGELIERNIQLTQLVAAVAANVDAAGVYWGAGTLVHDPQTFAEHASELTPDNLLPELWVDMRLDRKDESSYCFYTTGMRPLGHLEVEIDRTTLEPEEIMDFMYSIICYLLGGATIKDGETIGRTAEERIPVTHERSMWDREGNVMKMAFP